jgi:hypothetical protein
MAWATEWRRRTTGSTRSKSDCNFCHQLGNELTRTVDHVFKAKPELKTHAEAWEWRLGTGVRGTSMYGVPRLAGSEPLTQGVLGVDGAHRQGRGAAGAAAPLRRGAQCGRHALGLGYRPLVHARRDFDRQEPPDGQSLRANLRVSAGHGSLAIVDPKTNSTQEIDIPTRAPRAEVPSRFPASQPPVALVG